MMSHETSPLASPDTYAVQYESEQPTHVRSREEVEEMNRIHEQEQSRIRIAQRLGGFATSEIQPKTD